MFNSLKNKISIVVGNQIIKYAQRKQSRQVKEN